MDDVSRTDMIVALISVLLAANTALINSFGPRKLHSSVTVRKTKKKNYLMESVIQKYSLVL